MPMQYASPEASIARLVELAIARLEWPDGRRDLDRRGSDDVRRGGRQRLNAAAPGLDGTAVPG